MNRILNNMCEYLFFQVPRIHQKELDQYFKDKTIVITGASFGIGEACVKLLSNTPCKIILIARSTEKLQTLATEFLHSQCQIEIISVDLYELTAAEQIFQWISTNKIQVDILIHNAGKSIYRSVWKTLDRPQDINRTIAINYINPAQLTRLLLPDLKINKGQVIVVSTINAKLFAPPMWSSYQASKSAMQQWILAIQPELEVQQVNASLIYLPLVKTRMISPTQHYNHMPTMKVEEAAHAILKCTIKRNRQWQPWWLGIANLITKLLATPIYMFYVRHLRQSQ